MAKKIKHKSSNIVQWGSLSFSVTPKDITGVRDIAISGGSDTETVESGGVKYVKHKAGKPVEITLTAVLNAYLTDDIERRAREMVTLSAGKRTEYLYMGKSKPFTFKVALTDAKISRIAIAPGNRWVHCEVALTFKQASDLKGKASAITAGKGGKSGGRGGPKKVQVPTLKGKEINPETDLLTMEELNGSVNAAMQQNADAKAQSKKLTEDAMAKVRNRLLENVQRIGGTKVITQR